MTFTTAVVGGGLSGLVCARSLVARGDDVVVFDESERAGGVVRTERSNGYLLELGPNTVRPTPELSALVDELGLGGEVVLADARMPRYVDFGGRLHPLPMSPGALLGSRLLSARGKLRLFREPFVRRGDPAGESVRDFFARRLGPEVADRFVEPFVSGIWAGRSDALSAAQAFPAFARAEKEYGSLTRAGLVSFSRRKASRGSRKGLLSFRSGLEALPRRIAEELGPRMRFATRVESVRRTGKRWVLSAGGREEEADAVCIATPARDAARLLKDVDPQAAAALEAIPHPPLVVFHLALRGPVPLRGFGHLVVPQAARRILGAVWSSNLFSGRAPEGKSLLTVFLGGARDPAAIDLSDEDLLAAANRDLDAAFDTRTEIEPVRVTRYPRALPQYDFAHGERIAHLARVESAMPGLTILGNFRGGVSVGDVVRNARIVGQKRPRQGTFPNGSGGDLCS